MAFFVKVFALRRSKYSSGPGSHSNKAPIHQVGGRDQQSSRHNDGELPHSSANSGCGTLPGVERAGDRSDGKKQSQRPESGRPDGEISQAADHVIAAKDEKADNRKNAKHSKQRPQTQGPLGRTAAPLADACKNPERRVHNDRDDRERHKSRGEDFSQGYPRGDLLHGGLFHLNESALGIDAQQFKRGNGVRSIFFWYVAKLHSGNGQKGFVPAKRGNNKFAVLKVNPAETEQAFEKVEQFNAWRIRFINSTVVGGVRRQCCNRRQSRFLQLVPDVGTDRFADFFEGIAAAAI